MHWKTCCCETGYAHTLTTRGISFNVCVWHPHNINVIHKFALLNIVYDCLCPVQQLSLGPDRVVAKTDTQHSLASVSRAAPEVLASYKLRVIAPTLFAWLLGFPNTHTHTHRSEHTTTTNTMGHRGTFAVRLWHCVLVLGSSYAATVVVVVIVAIGTRNVLRWYWSWYWYA